MILADTSVWIDHFRKGNPGLMRLLERGDVLTHPFVVGELACGNLANRTEILSTLSQLPRAAVASDAEALGFIERRSLHGRGVGYIDIHLLASTALDSDARIWTLDRRLESIATDLGCAFSP